ncbi:MAG: hypothetical protein RMI85_01140, partial [Candidatus Korarchaeum sp.]|nr:hypothetical protein [Candidatus Korarchaeum sp.]
IRTAEHEGTLVLIIEEGGKEVVIYIMAEEDRSVVYVIASANPPMTVGGRALDLLKSSWEIVDRGIPCKVCLNEDVVVVEHDIDPCHLNKESLLESIYFTAESMLYLMDKLSSECSEG